MNNFFRGSFFICCILFVCLCLNLNYSLKAQTTITSGEQECEFVGHVYNPDGTLFKPSKDSYVTVVLEVKSNEIIEYISNVRDDGTYSIPIDKHYGSEYTITAYARGIKNPYASSYVMYGEINSCCVEHQIRLMMPVVEGRVLDPEGNLLDDYIGVTVSIWLPADEGQSMSTRTSAMVNEDGSYKIGTFQFYKDSFLVSAHIDYEKNPKIEFADGQETLKRDDLWGSVVYRDIKLTKPILQGRVYNSDGTPFNPKKHRMYEIITKPIGGFSNGRIFNTVIDDKGFYRLGGDIVHGTTFVIKGYCTTHIDGVGHISNYDTSIIPKTIKVSDNNTQNVDLFFGEPGAETFSFSEEIKILKNNTYSFRNRQGIFCYSKDSKKIEGQECTNFILETPIDISNSTSIEFSNINFTSSAEILTPIVKCSDSKDIVFRNCEFSDVHSVVINNSLPETNISISFINCSIHNIYGDVFLLNENDLIYLRDCEISKCASLTNIPNAIYDEGNNEIVDIGPERCGALISGRILNPDGSLHYPKLDYKNNIIVFENTETKQIYEIEAYNAKYVVKEGIPEGRYRILYKHDEKYEKGIDSGIVVNIDKNESTVQDIYINNENINININILDSMGEIFKYGMFKNTYDSTMKVIIYNESGKIIETELLENEKIECDIPTGDYMVKMEWYFSDKLLGVSEPFKITVGDEDVLITRSVQLNPVINNAAFVGDGWIKNIKTGHYYKNTKGFSYEFDKNEEEANELGGHLATVNNQEENDWLESIWGDFAETYWIGYYYDESLHSWKWTSNEDTEFTNWYKRYDFKQPIGDKKGTLFNMSYTPYSWEGHESGKWSTFIESSDWCNVGIIEVDNLEARPAVPTHTPSSKVMGDVNSNGEFNSLDFAMMRQFLLGRIDSFPTEDGLTFADVNKDKSVNSLDFAMMRQFLLGIINEFPN